MNDLRNFLGRVTLRLGVLCAACGGTTDEGDDVPVLVGDGPVRLTSKGGVNVDVVPYAPIRRGKNDIVVRVGESDASLVGATAVMPAHDHGSPTPLVEREGDTFVVRGLVLYMPGRWELHLTLGRGTGRDDAVVAIDVP